MARGRQAQIWRCVLAGGMQRSSLSVKRTVPAFTGAEASATACPATVGAFSSAGLAEFRRCGGELAFPWRGGGLRRPHFFLRRKKCGKESRLDLRSKGPLARYGLCKIGGADLAELVRWVTLSVQGTACTSCAAAADSSEGRGWCAGRVAIIKSRLWRLAAAKVGVPVGHGHNYSLACDAAE